MNLLFRGSVSISSILTDDGNVVESAAVSQPLSAAESNVHWQGAGTVAAGALEVLDLRSLPQEAFGDEGTVGFSQVHAVYLRNTGTVDIKLGEWEKLVGSTDGTGHLTIRPGGLLVLTAPAASGLAVAAGDSLSITNASSAEAGFEILIVGVRA